MSKFRVQASVLQKMGRWRCLAILLLTLGILFAACPAYCSDYFVAPDGDDSNDGTIDSPFRTIDHAEDLVVAGDTIFLRGGTHSYDYKIGISESGAPENLITLQNYQNESVILDFSEQPYDGSYRGISLSGDYWYFKGINIKGAGDNGMNISGSNNIIEFCTFYENRDTGLQLSNGAAYNQIINCDSYYNFDPPNGEDADGFAPKLTVGTGNYFYGCRAWQNSDDAYDGYDASDVNTTYENCWAFKAGYLKSGAPSSGNGNGFKMGGNYSRHNVILENCLCFNNKAKGFDQNHNMGSMTLYNCTSFSNGGDNYKIYEAPASGKTATVTNCVSHAGGEDLRTFVVQTTNSWMSPFVVTDADFVSVDPSTAYGARNADGSLPNIPFMRLALGSDLIDGGTDVGLPYNDSAPDLGALERYPDGDCEPDGDVDWADLGCLSLNWLDSNCVDCNGADFDDDGDVDLYDFNKLAGNWSEY